MKSFQMQLADIPAVQRSIPSALTRPIMLASPHSGRAYPTSFVEQSRLNHATLRRSEDFCIDLLFDFAPSIGIPIICAEFPRCYVDVNRGADELDPILFLQKEHTKATPISRRVANGLGVIPRVVGAGVEIYGEKLTLAEGRARLDQFHQPYHSAVKALAEQVSATFKTSLFIDCHSMPDSAAGRKLPAGKTTDIVIGDLHGQACAPRVTQAAVITLREMGYSVSRNDPYAGGYTTQTYGRPAMGRHCLQLEINRRLYMDERRLKLTASFDTLQRDMRRFVEHMANVMEEMNRADPTAIAAE
ncbi:MAG: N-formylglutamate amidohydrolase [Pseudomonadota bacterium]